MTGWHKSVRALFAALMTTLLALLMHAGAGGEVSPLGTGLVFVIVLWAAMILAGRRLGYLALSSILGLGQLLMHLSMGWFGPGSVTSTPAEAAAGTASTGPDTAVGMSSAEHLLMTPATGSLDLSGTAAMGHAMNHGSGLDAPMILAHLGAIVVTAVVLKRGEDLLFNILTLALGPVAIALRTLTRVQHSLADAGSGFASDVRALPSMLATAVIGPNYRRGPPALA